MGLRLHNTLTKRTEAFEPAQPGLVRMYVCGPSVYDRTHVGHARSYVFYDTLRRYLEHHGLRVLHVQNFTDIEENIALRAQAAGVAPLDYASNLIDAFFEDMDALNVQRAAHYPRVSEHIDDILQITQTLCEKGTAYEVDCRDGTRDGAPDAVCDVYFDVTKAPGFGRLVGQRLEDLTVTRPEEKGDRRHPMDFALWKSRADWGLTWHSPYGDGRPGWHVECTAMALKHLGPNFDIHGGGLDLVFPHHESETVIGEHYLDAPYCRFYVHNGFVTVDRQKMSKSKGNFVTVREMRERHAPDALRLFLLSRHYRAPLNFQEEGIREAQARLDRWRAAATQLARAAGATPAAPAEALAAPVCDARKRFFAALDDDLQLGDAIAALDEAAHAARDATLPADQAAAALAFLQDATGILGVQALFGK